MRLKPRFWFLLSLLFFTAGLCLWQAGDRLADSRRASTPAASVPSVPSVPPVPSAPATAPAPAAPAPASAVLSAEQHGAKPAELARNPRAILLRNALIDTTRPRSLAIPEALRSQGAPGSYLVQSDRALNAEFYAALAAGRGGVCFLHSEQRGAGAGHAGGGAGDGGGRGCFRRCCLMSLISSWTVRCCRRR